MTFHVPHQFRVRRGVMSSDDSIGNNGAFMVPNRAAKQRGLSTREHSAIPLQIIASDGVFVPEESPELRGWEHVSVSLPHRCPTQDEMCFVKSVFWDAEDCVVQYHPPESEYVNNHAFCLHLWRRIEGFPMPPSILVGLRRDLAERA